MSDPSTSPLRLSRPHRDLYALTTNYLERRISDTAAVDGLTALGIDRALDIVMKLDERRDWYLNTLPDQAVSWLDANAGFGDTNRTWLDKLGIDMVLSDHADDHALAMNTRQLTWSGGHGIAGWMHTMTQMRGIEIWLAEKARIGAAVVQAAE